MYISTPCVVCVYKIVFSRNLNNLVDVEKIYVYIIIFMYIEKLQIRTLPFVLCLSPCRFNHVRAWTCSQTDRHNTRHYRRTVRTINNIIQYTCVCVSGCVSVFVRYRNNIVETERRASIPCAGTCGPSSATARARRTDSSGSGSASACPSARSLPAGRTPGPAWTSRSPRPWSSPASGAGAGAPPPCWCPCTRTRTSDSGNATPCSGRCLRGTNRNGVRLVQCTPRRCYFQRSLINEKKKKTNVTI